MDLGLKGKRAIVLGATRGIGRRIAEQLAEEGAQVAICARNSDQVDETVAALSAKTDKALGGVVDISDGDQLKSWVSSAIADLGGLDILISSASALANGNDEGNWQAGFDIDVMGAQRSVAVAEEALKKAAAEHGDASITIIASVSAIETDHPNSYGALKAALIHYAKGLARELAADHVRCNVVSPGTVYFEGGVWGMVKENMPDVFDEYLGKNPMGRMATPDDISNAVVFLSSPRSSFTTGINFLVDGALSRRVAL